MNYCAHIGNVVVKGDDNYTITKFPTGEKVVADHSEQPGQAETAIALGYRNAEHLNSEHDLAHSLLSHWLGLTQSPTLYGVATKKFFPHHDVEEEAVLAVQKFARLMGVSLTRLASRI